MHGIVKIKLNYRNIFYFLYIKVQICGFKKTVKKLINFKVKHLKDLLDRYQINLMKGNIVYVQNQLLYQLQHL